MSAWATYVGWTPAPDRDLVENCWSFVVQVMRAEFGIELPSYEGQEPTQFLEDSRVSDGWTETWVPLSGDIVMLRAPDSGKLHVGIYIGNEKMLHYGNKRIGATIERVSSPIWKGRVLGYFRHRAA